MPAKVKPEDMHGLAEIYNREGDRALRETLCSQYGVRKPYAIVRKMKLSAELHYDEVSDRFLLDSGIVEGDGVFLSMDELCAGAKAGASKNHKTNREPAQGEAMEKLIQTLIGDRLLELSRYVTLNTMSKTVALDRTALESDGYHLDIY